MDKFKNLGLQLKDTNLNTFFDLEIRAYYVASI